ncbi:uncharacterized protein LOC124360543 [Homalodisca vitripennis]|uniref:uncharacterized protein LOC124360543 n=1 Tax=Homalodisca vitripennis TaxID=197043 RepID=UPI001EEA522C|nr:uncharacterized protein LOC124360543 [Homalodisca vitripennis]KAG8253338.1 hypothetical protein J6590_036862 [Homalodisca vitripennis]
MAAELKQIKVSEEEAVKDSLQRNFPAIRVDRLKASSEIKDNENFMGIITKLDVDGYDSEKGEEVHMSLIMKTMPDSAKRRATFNVEAAFSNEAAFYSRVLPTLVQYADLKFAPCLQARTDLILLRHLGQDGYVLADRKEGLDLQHCELVLRELAKYHAVSLALKHTDPATFNQIKSEIREVFVTGENVIINKSYDVCIDMALKVTTDLESKAVTMLKGIQGNSLKLMIPFAAPKEPLAVICHGDLWSNNLLFRYSPDNSKTPIDVTFLDLQGCRYASPSLDIMYFLFSSTKKDVTKQNFRHLVVTYHRSLVEHLKRLAPLAPTVTLDDIMVQIKQHAAFGMVMSLAVLPAVTADKLSYTIDDVTEECLHNEEFLAEAEKGIITPEFKRRVNTMFEVVVLEGLI